MPASHQITDRALYRTRLTVLFARNAPLAVVLRRGPKRHYRLILWDLTDDGFTAGQWMKGKIGLCDLSPDGDKLLYIAAQYSPVQRSVRIARAAAAGYDPLWAMPLKVKDGRIRRRVPRYLGGSTGAFGQVRPRSPDRTCTWTAVSTPPYFTALAFWPAHGTWTGGGLFIGQRVIGLYESADGMTPVTTVAMPASLRLHQIAYGDGVASSAMSPSYRPEGELTADIWASLLVPGSDRVDWVRSDPAGDLLFAADGRIFRLPAWRSVAPHARLAAARILCDLRPMAFEGIVAPADALAW
jgi:hypothetical protein